MGTDQVFGMDGAGDGSGGDYCGTVFLRRLVENDVELISFQRRKSDLETSFWKMTEEN